jgi:2-polyprenyl-3-methyl-5-hydroxy-6-metoxy-1,4-benzoquinol methylase
MKAVVEHFDRMSTTGDWTRLYEAPDGFNYHFQVRRNRVLELLPDRLGRVLDIGCGPGVMVEAVLSRGGTFEGVDLSPEMVREASDRFASEGVSFSEGSIEALQQESDAYDQVICMAVIEYLDTPDKAFSEIARVLRPGGTAIVTVPKRWHVDRVTIAATFPARALAKAMGATGTDKLKRLRLQPDELDRSAQAAGLIPDGGAQYHFTPLPYPLPRLLPSACMRMNRPFERLFKTRSALPSFLAHGYVGRYRKPAKT